MLIFWFNVVPVGVNQVSINRFRLIREGVIWGGVIWLRLNFRIFALIFFNFKINIAPSVFENAFTSKVFTYRCTMPWRRIPVGKIRRIPEIFKSVESPWPGTMWEVVSDESMWVHTKAVITTPPDSSPPHVRRTLHIVEEDFPITLSLSVNGIGYLVGLYDSWFTCRIIQNNFSTPKRLLAIYHNHSRPQRFSYERQWSRFHPSAVGVSQLIRHHFFKRILLKRSGQ